MTSVSAISYTKLRSMFFWVFAVVIVLTMLAGFVLLPVRTYTALTSKKESAKVQMATIEDDIVQLEQELANLKTDSEIERRARKDFGLVYPGEESYRIVE